MGKQAGDAVLMILQTNNFELQYQRMNDNGVEFIEEPRREPYGIVAIFKDLYLYGDKWDLIQRT